MDLPAYVHFASRAWKHFKVELSKEQVAKMEGCIERGYFSRICDQERGARTLYRVPIGKRVAAVVYHNVRKTIVTIMPVEWTMQSVKMERKRRKG